MNRIAVYGAGSLGREVLPMIKRSLGTQANLRFVDDKVAAGVVVNSVPVVSLEQALADDRRFVIAIADWRARKRLAESISAVGGKFLSVAPSTVIAYYDVEMGEGAVLCDYTVISSNIRIGKHFHANYHCYVAHDCIIGDYVTFGPRVACLGRVRIEDHAFIGAGAVIRQGRADRPLVIGAGAVVGMGAIVTKDVAPGMTVVGNPARQLVKP
jgi:sugar O-acyltransferase (sialic acid O-acetyltransferase NeuD family)